MAAEKKSFNFWPKIGLSNIRQFILGYFSMLILLGACQQYDKIQGDRDPISKESTHIAVPEVIILDSINDSIQPQKIWIKNTSQPTTVYVPSYKHEEFSFQDDQNQTRTITAPLTIPRSYLKNDKGEALFDSAGNHYFLGDGGMSHFTSYTTDDGLGLDNITSSLLDRSGNLWFGTWGGGISKFDGVSFTNFSTAHGLSNNLVHCLAEDVAGNIWIGTEGGGISIYDGYSFTQKTKSHGLTNDVVYGITRDKKGNMWIASGEGGALKFDGERFVHFNENEGLKNNSVIKIAEDNNGYIWFGTGSNGVLRFDGKSFMHFTVEDGLAENLIYCIYKDKKGNLWFGTEGGGISKYQENTDSNIKGTFINYTISEGLGHNDIWDIKEDLEGNMWFATGGGGVSKFDGKSFTNFTTSQGLPENVVYSISPDGSGYLWFGTAGGGVALYRGHAFSNYSSSLGLAKNSVYGIVEDNDGSLWFGTDGGGVSKYDGKSFTNFTTDQGLPHPLIISTVKDKYGQLWFGTGGGGIALYKESTGKEKKVSFTTFNSKNGLPSDIIYAIKEDRFGNLWLGTGGGGLVKFDWNITDSDDAGFTIFSTDHGLSNNWVYSITEDSKGNLWIGTGGGGVSKFDGKSFTNYTTAQGLSNNIVWSILEDKAGNMWFATQGGGVSRYDGQSFSTFSKKEGLVDDTVYDLLEDELGNIFIGTNQGFTVIPAPIALLPFHEMRDHLEYYNTANGYPVKDVNKGIYLDRKGNLWVGNGSEKTGLVKFNYQALGKKKEKPSIKIKNISLNEKLISWKSLENKYTEERVTDNISSKSYIADEVKVYGRELSPEERDAQGREFSKVQFSDIRRFDNFPEKLVLPYSHNQITIGFGTDELVRPGLMEYKYILEGYRKSWSPIVKNSSATFGNIREGDYVFRVMARYTGPAEAEGKEWSEEAVYRFSVLPPRHRSWWAYLLYLIVLFVGIKRVHVFQKNKTIQRERHRIQQKELEQAKEIEKAYTELQLTQAQLIQQEKLASLGQLTAGIAHEIKNPLNFVNNFSEVSIEMIEEALGEIEKEPEARDEKLIRENLQDIRYNLQKVLDHGTRANSIVTSMLQHSRDGSGEMEPTDLNALIKEYVNLCYQGMLAGKSPLHVDITLELDPHLPMVQLVKEDFSRVVINLCINAFDAMREKVLKSEDGRLKTEVGDSGNLKYDPNLKVSTNLENDQVRIAFEDNGPGITNEIKDKILQPFFTTKKGTEGTGLGLSITHDIVKAHGGELNVESEIGRGAIFSIYLPCN